MTLAIMQPYLFPYIGYWQLINTVDTFVIYDDVNFIKQGYINKNYILSDAQSKSFSLELIGASSNKLINEIQVGRNRDKLLKTLNQNYIKAPYFNIVFPILENILTSKEKNLAKFIGYSLEKISHFLEIDTVFIYSSEIQKNNDLKGQDKIIDINKILNSSKYINAIGGQNLYETKVFKKENLELNFLDTEIIEYKQFKNEFVPLLSIIDVIMFNSKDEIKGMLERFELI